MKLLILSAIIAMIVCGCEKTNSPSGKDFTSGVFIVNEGAFTHNDGSITFFDPVGMEVTNGIFEAANNRPVGDIVQSFAVVNDTAGYILVNNSAKLEIVSLKDFKSRTEPIPVDYPRFFMQVTPTKGYISSGNMQGSLYVMDLSLPAVTDTITVGNGPETMVMTGNKLIVANSGGFGVDSTLSIVDINSDRVTGTIAVNKVPVDMVLDAANRLWVYCKGYAVYNWDPPYDLISESEAVIQEINPESGEIIWQHQVGKAGDYIATPPRIAVSGDGQTIYYLRPDGLYKLDVHSPAIAPDVFIPGGFYGVDVNPMDERIYLFEGSFTGNGMLKIYDIEGNIELQQPVGISPSGAVFHLR